MKAVIDTNIIIDLFNGIEQAKQELSQYESPIISIITWIELFIGVDDEKEKQIINNFLGKFIIQQVDIKVAQQAVEIRKSSKKKLPDAIIEATAKVNGTILVTRNIKDFNDNLPHVRVPYNLV